MLTAARPSRDTNLPFIPPSWAQPAKETRVNGQSFRQQYYGIDNAVADFFNEIAKVKGIKLAPEDYERAFGVCVSSYSNYASFRNQTKDEVSDGFIQDAVYSTVYDTLKVEFSKGNKLIATVIDEVFERAERRILLREQAKLTKEANKVKKLKKPDKFVTCKAYEKKQYDQAELWIAEGDSANTSLKEFPELFELFIGLLTWTPPIFPTG